MQKIIDRIRAAAEAVRAKSILAAQLVLVAVISYVVFPPAVAAAFVIGAARSAASAVAGRARAEAAAFRDFYSTAHRTMADVVREFRGVADQ